MSEFPNIESQFKCYLSQKNFPIKRNIMREVLSNHPALFPSDNYLTLLVHYLCTFLFTSASFFWVVGFNKA